MISATGQQSDGSSSGSSSGAAAEVLAVPEVLEGYPPAGKRGRKSVLWASSVGSEKAEHGEKIVDGKLDYDHSHITGS